MKKAKLIWALSGLFAAGCAQTAPPVSAPPAPVNQASAAPAALPAPAPAPVVDAATLVAAQANLRALGYTAGKSADSADPAFQHALMEFEKDQGLTPDGQLSDAVVDRLKLVRAALAHSTAAEPVRDALFLYSDGVSSRQPIGLLLPPPHGLSSDAPAKFLEPLRPGSQASYHLGHAKDGSVSPDITVTCHAGKFSQSALPIGILDTIPVDCDGAGAESWHSLYSPKLNAVVRQESAGHSRDLIAVRVFTGSWPSAARTGLDWALTHALDAPLASVPVQWSSTAVTPHFEIKVTAAVSGQEAGLSSRFAALFCRRFEMAQPHSTAAYPGIACQDKAGSWSIPGSDTVLASPASGIGAHAAAPQRSARN